MIINIFSSNPNTLSVLNKNPKTDNGLYVKPHRNGHIIGNVYSDTTYEILFHDTKYSYTNDKSNQLDFRSMCAPEAVYSIIKELFGHLMKDAGTVNNTDIPWLNTTLGEIDTENCSIDVYYVWVDSNWMRDGVFLLQRYIKGITLVPEGDYRYKLNITGGTIVEAINKLCLVTFFMSVTNDNKVIYFDKNFIRKYSSILLSLEGIPYFVFYLFIKRMLGSENLFEELVPKMQEYLEKQLGTSVVFTPNDTHLDRLKFIKRVLYPEENVFNFGCGEMRLERYLAKTIKGDLISYDQEDYSELYEKFRNRVPGEWKYIKTLRELPKKKSFTLVMSEVIEHNHPKKMIKEILKLWKRDNIRKLVITTPNAPFNHYYNIDGMRREDHVFEFNLEEFKQFCESIKGDKLFFKVGDKIGGEAVTNAVVIQKV